MDLVKHIADYKKLVDKRVDAVETRIDKVEIDLGKKIDWKWFFGAIISIFGVIAVILSAMWSEIKGISEITQKTENTVSKIEGKLEPFDFISN